jgi:hypothetical protein
MSSNIVFLEVPYDKKEYAKALGAKWDKLVKKWYCDEGKKILIDEFSIHYVKYSFNERETAKNLGYKYDPERKEWYTYKSNIKNI